MKMDISDKIVTVYLKGVIDTNNSAAVEKELLGIMGQNKDRSFVLDCSELNYISSSGLRVLLKLEKMSFRFELVNVTSEVYEILSVTGFTELLTVRKKLREISIDNAELLGAGANGRVYRLDSERIVKVYNKISNPPEKIRREQESARRAFVKGIPSAIPFDIVRAGDQLGMIYELINARTLGSIVHSDPGKIEEYAVKMSSLLKKLHSTEMEKDTMPDSRLTLKVWADIADKSGYFTKEDMQRVYDLIDSIPPRNTFIHGDFHPGNIMVSDGELILIDMGDSSAGHPVVDLLGTYQLMSLIPGQNEKAAMRYLGMTTDEAQLMWNIFIRDYLGTDDDDKVREAEGSLKSYSLIRSLGGIVFSDVIPDDKRRLFSGFVMKNFLCGIDKADIIIKSL